MTIRELAAHYLRYYSLPGQPAVNAPEELRKFLASQRAENDPYSLHNALLSLAGRPLLEHPPAAAWLAAQPGRTRHCDTVLRSRKPPTTWDELVSRAYAQAQQEILDTVRSFLKARIESF